MMEIGYIIASDQVVKDGLKIGYLYREDPDSEADSGWRVFSGEETQEYADDSSNFKMYNASTILALDPQIGSLLGSVPPVSFERNEESGEFIELEEGD